MPKQMSHILVVEDEPAHVEMIRRAFEPQTSTVNLSVVRGLREAYKHLSNFTPDLIITDLSLPDGKGIELLPGEKTETVYPVIIMTSYGDEQMAVDALKAGALDYVVKSEVSLAAMSRIAERALRQWSHITKRKRAEEALRESEEYLRATLSSMSDLVFVLNRKGVFTDFHRPENLHFLYADPKKYLNKHFSDVLPPSVSELLNEAIQKVVTTNTVQQFDYRLVDKGESLWFNARVSMRKGRVGEYDGVTIVARNITQRKQAEEERARLETQLHQAQKMETVGTLAAGIAHDFNNLLLVINGFAELIQMEMQPGNVHQEAIDKILHAGRRAAELVSQLLAFSRKQIIRPQVINLYTTLGRVEKMLGRVIGENIELKTILHPNLWSIKVDPTQIDQIIVNLAVNARDAMPNGGQLTIEISNIVLDDDYIAHHLGTQAGDHILLAISDTGHGMNKEMQERIFDPFFTTKEVGKGTGLGLATVFGIVKQSGGDIWVYSEENIGTTFKIYLPRAQQPAVSAVAARSKIDLPSGNETILLVEDDIGVRKLTRVVLEGQGYIILDARNGQNALQIAANHTSSIDLLLTDVIMPGISGKALAEKLAQTQPNLKTLFMSGYTNNAAVEHNIVNPDINFLQKPFSPKALAHKIREVLDS